LRNKIGLEYLIVRRAKSGSLCPERRLGTHQGPNRIRPPFGHPLLSDATLHRCDTGIQMSQSCHGLPQWTRTWRRPQLACSLIVQDTEFLTRLIMHSWFSGKISASHTILSGHANITWILRWPRVRFPEGAKLFLDLWKSYI
jgi:hypothetical protein